MKEKVKILIKTNQDEENKEWTTEGVMFEEGGRYVVSYPDYAGNALTNNRLELNNDSIRIIRSGAINSDMIFEQDMMTPFEYRVILVSDKMELYTKKYHLAHEGNKMICNLEYEIYGSGEMVTENKMEITVTG